MSSYLSSKLQAESDCCWNNFFLILSLFLSFLSERLPDSLPKERSSQCRRPLPQSHLPSQCQQWNGLSFPSAPTSSALLSGDVLSRLFPSDIIGRSLLNFSLHVRAMWFPPLEAKIKGHIPASARTDLFRHKTLQKSISSASISDPSTTVGIENDWPQSEFSWPSWWLWLVPKEYTEPWAIKFGKHYKAENKFPTKKKKCHSLFPACLSKTKPYQSRMRLEQFSRSRSGRALGRS